MSRAMLITLSLCLSACGAELEVSSYDYSSDEMISVDDIEVTYNKDINISGEMISDTFSIINSHFDGLSISEVIKSNNVSIHFVPDEAINARGEYHFDSNEIFISPASEESEEVVCLDTYYLLSHELLHVISRYHLNESNKDNKNHNNESLFVDHSEDFLSTIEWSIYMDLSSLCSSK